MQKLFQRTFKYLTSVLGIALIVFQGESAAKTRLSALHMIPDADMLEGGQYVIDLHGYYFADSLGQKFFRPTGLFALGFIEWVNIEAGYADGFTFELKARILGETSPGLPSLALGSHNIFSHKEVNYYNEPRKAMTNEIFIVIGKSIDPLRLRFHGGIQSIPTYTSEIFNPFFAVEKYFGGGLYVAIEAHRRDKKYHPSFFTSWRFLKKSVELSAGITDFVNFFTDDDDKFSASIEASPGDGFVKPGIWMGLRYSGRIGNGKKGAFMSLEDRISDQTTSFSSIQGELDSLRGVIQTQAGVLEKLQKSVSEVSGVSATEDGQLGVMVLQKLIALKTLYEQEPFEPEQVKSTVREIVSFRDRIIPGLQEIVSDRNQDRAVRILGISMIGEIGNTAASEILLDVIVQSQDPDMKIEALIALGKMKETRAMYLMHQLASDPNDAVAFTATEVLQKIEKETGISLKTGADSSTVLPSGIEDKKIEGRDSRGSIPSAPPGNAGVSVPAPKGDTLSEKISDPTFKGLTRPYFSQATVTSHDSTSLKRDSLSSGAPGSETVPAAVPQEPPAPVKKAEAVPDADAKQTAPVKSGKDAGTW